MSIAEQDTQKERVEIAEEVSRPQHAAATVSAMKMFRFSRYVHVGPDVDACILTAWLSQPREQREGAMPECVNPDHFHAWIRLPNKFQHADIHAKALAAKARKMRTLRDPESDASIVLEAEIAELRELGDDNLMIDELMTADWSKDYLVALGDVNEDEAWANVDQDREEYERIVEGEMEKPEEERSDAFRELERHLEGYRKAIHDRLAEIQKPARDGLLAKGHDAIVDLIREQRVGGQGDKDFIQTYNKWTWLSGTMKPAEHDVTHQPHIPAFTSLEDLEGQAPEIIEALGEAFADIETAIQQGASGNS